MEYFRYMVLSFHMNIFVRHKIERKFGNHDSVCLFCTCIAPESAKQDRVWTAESYHTHTHMLHWESLPSSQPKHWLLAIFIENNVFHANVSGFSFKFGQFFLQPIVIRQHTLVTAATMPQNKKNTNQWRREAYGSESTHRRSISVLVMSWMSATLPPEKLCTRLSHH